jgi:hypothetical protein
MARTLEQRLAEGAPYAPSNYFAPAVGHPDAEQNERLWRRFPELRGVVHFLRRENRSLVWSAPCPRCQKRRELRSNGVKLMKCVSERMCHDCRYLPEVRIAAIVEPFTEAQRARVRLDKTLIMVECARCHGWRSASYRRSDVLQKLADNCRSCRQELRRGAAIKRGHAVRVDREGVTDRGRLTRAVVDGCLAENLPQDEEQALLAICCYLVGQRLGQMKLGEIGIMLGLSRERIRQLEVESLRELRESCDLSGLL